MNEAEKLELVRNMSGETNISVLSSYLSIAGNKVCRKAYPYNPEIQTVPAQYGYIQVEIAVYLLNKRGAEGETMHSENGISRNYESGDVPTSLLRDIIPCASVIGG